MSAVVDVVLPVFALIATGYAVGRAGVLGPNAQTGLNLFTYWLALPALLFIGMARMPLDDIFNAEFLIAYNAGWLGAFLLAWGLDAVMTRRRGAEERVIVALSAGFPNVGYMGVPLLLIAFGPAGQAPAVIAAVIASAVKISLALILIEAARGGIGGAALLRTLSTPLKSPIVLAPIAGIALSALGLPVPSPIAAFCDILGGAAGPCALIAAGMFLVGKPFGAAGLATTTMITAMKLIVNPLIAWVLVTFVVPMPPLYAQSAIILSALPTGALVFLVADRYGAYIEGCSAAILASTALSAITLSIIFAYFG